MSCSTALSWGALYPAALLGASRAGLPVVRHRRLSGAPIRTIAICLVRCRFLADCRPPPAICWWPSTGCGSRRRIRWRSRVALYPASLPDVLAQFGGEDYNDDLARLKSLLGNLGCAIPRCISSTRKCASAGRRAVYRFRQRPGFQQLRGWSGAGGFDLSESEPLSALYWRASGCAKIGIKLFPGLRRVGALAGLWFTVSDGSVARKGASGDASGKQRAMFSAARG